MIQDWCYNLSGQFYIQLKLRTDCKPLARTLKSRNCHSWKRIYAAAYQWKNVVCFHEWQLWFLMRPPVVCNQFVISIEFKIVQSDCSTNLKSTWYPKLISGPSSRYECFQTCHGLFMNSYAVTLGQMIVDLSTTRWLTGFPGAYWIKLSNIGIWVCFSCTLHKAVLFHNWEGYYDGLILQALDLLLGQAERAPGTIG